MESFKLTRPEKILICIYKLSGGTKKKLRYEDIVVGLFKNYPDEFALRGYSQYPDSEAINKAIYTESMKRSGFIDYSNKIFSLTELGVSRIKRILSNKMNKQKESTKKLSRFALNEVNRIKSTEGFNLFSLGDLNNITDTDFFNYFGITSRTSRNDFLKRLKTLEEVLKELKQGKDATPLHKKLVDYHGFLLDRFKNIISHYISS